MQKSKKLEDCLKEKLKNLLKGDFCLKKEKTNTNCRKLVIENNINQNLNLLNLRKSRLIRT